MYMKSRISIDEATHSFSTLVERVRTGGEEFIVQSNGEDVCHIVPVRQSFTARQLVETLQRLPRPDDEYLDQVQAIIDQQPQSPPSPWDH
jgi:prevent-host-death family protein